MRFRANTLITQGVMEAHAVAKLVDRSSNNEIPSIKPEDLVAGCHSVTRTVVLDSLANMYPAPAEDQGYPQKANRHERRKHSKLNRK